MGAPQGHQRSDSTCSLVSLTTPLGKNVASVMLVGLVGAFDFTASLMSIQPYYYFLKGPERLYGVTFGCYDIFQILAVPIFARFVDRTGRFRNCFVFGILLTNIGNILYASLIVIDNWAGGYGTGYKLMIVSRCIMGFGSATLITGLTYITKFTTMKQRFGAVGSYRIAQTIARMIGPSIGFIFVGLPDPVKDKSVILNLFNFFTMPGWLSAVLGFVSIFLVMRWFCDEAVPVPEIASGDDDSNGARESCGAALEKSQEEVSNLGGSSVESLTHCSSKFVFSVHKGGIVRSTLYAFFICFLLSMVQWTITSNMFAFATGLYHAVRSQTDLWKPWTGYAIGALCASQSWKLIGRKCGQRIPFIEKKFAFVGGLLICFGCMFFLRFSTYSKGKVSHQALMWVGTTILGMGVIFFQTNLEVVYSKVITDKFEEVGRNHGLFLGAYQISGSLSRFLGPVIGGSLLFPVVRTYGGGEVYQTDSALENCPPDGWPCYESERNRGCNNNKDIYCDLPSTQCNSTTVPPLSQVCCFTTSHYYIENCEVAHNNVTISTLLVCGALAVYTMRHYFRNVANYPCCIIASDTAANRDIDETSMEVGMLPSNVSRSHSFDSLLLIEMEEKKVKWDEDGFVDIENDEEREGKLPVNKRARANTLS